MNRKFRISVVVGMSLFVLLIMTACQDEIEIHTTGPVPVYLTDGWETSKGNAIIGTLPAGTIVRGTTIVEKDHMVYKIEYAFSPGKNQVGYVMYNGGCDKNFREAQVYRNLFKKEDVVEERCPR